jgi:hypothetical protein
MSEQERASNRGWTNQTTVGKCVKSPGSASNTRMGRRWGSFGPGDVSVGVGSARSGYLGRAASVGCELRER